LTFLAFLFCTILTFPGRASAADPTSLSNRSSRYTVKVKSGENTYVGHPIVHNHLQTVLLRRNGRIKMFKPGQVDDLQQVSNIFSPKTARQLRVELQKEFGSKYEVSLTRHYVVVHPPGAYQRWALPFEQYYVRFRQWFTARGMKLKHPEFPMVAIVLLDRSEYDRFTSRYTSFSYSTDGYFSSSSNRMITYDKSGGQPSGSSAATFETMTTVIHEAVHQAGHNIGIHSRFFPQPQWFKEGLATLFEAPGINHPAAHPRADQRIDPYSLIAAARFLDKHDKPGVVEQLIRTDSFFNADATSAYGLSWALTSYLFERFPRQYVQYVKVLNENAATASATPDARMKYFTRTFGATGRIEGGLRSYVSKLAQ
jgi:hypothetical protein